MQEMQEKQVSSLGREDPLEVGLATYSSILAWRIPTDRGAWWATVHRVAKSRTWLKQLSTCIHVEKMNRDVCNEWIKWTEKCIINKWTRCVTNELNEHISYEWNKQSDYNEWLKLAANGRCLEIPVRVENWGRNMDHSKIGIFREFYFLTCLSSHESVNFHYVFEDFFVQLFSQVSWYKGRVGTQKSKVFLWFNNKLFPKKRWISEAVL